MIACIYEDTALTSTPSSTAPAQSSTTPAPSLTWYVDADGDTYGDASDGGATSTIQPSGYVDNNLDCDDDIATGAAINPGATELNDDQIDF